MVRFTAAIAKFGQQEEKTGWTYIAIPEDIAALIHPGVKKIVPSEGYNRCLCCTECCINAYG